MKVECYSLSDAADIEAMKSRLNQSFAVLIEHAESQAAEVLDTFDWRLHGKGWQLLRRGGQFEIFEGSAARRICGIDVAPQGPRRFAWDFPASELTEHLAPVLEMRALIPMATVEKQFSRINVCNAEKKTVGRLEIESLRIKDEAPVVTHCRVLPVRGYEKESRRIKEILDDLGLTPVGVPAVIELLEKSGAAPGAYSSKVNVSLNPETPASEAVRLIMENLICVMHQNLAGVKEDIDSEFLHDLRVAVRRARSLLSQLKGVLDADVTADLMARLKAMGTVTGPVRDLDVYLLKKNDYISRVPDALRPGVLQLFRALQRKRRYAQERMVKAMDGAAFGSALEALDAFIHADPPAAAGNPGTSAPIGEMAKAVIFKRFRRIIKKGSRISDDTADERLHELRIDCKKLRYLLEFFISLFPNDQMKILIKQLKQLQENLGDFNDLSVQQAFLIQYLETVRPQASQAVMLAAAVGGLITRLCIDQHRIRSQFLNVFKPFGSQENQARFVTLFA